MHENRVWIRISSICNNKCLFCLDSDSQDGTFVSSKVIYEKINSWLKSWCKNRIILSWWEASINPNFIKYIRYAKDLWYKRIQTITNWIMFSDEYFCDNVINAWLEEITFSFHWHNENLHDFLVWSKWAFKKSLKWLIYIKKTHPSIILNIDIVVNRINIKFLPDIIKFFIRLWINEFDILQIIPFWRWFKENKTKLFYNIEWNLHYLYSVWELSNYKWINIWTNRFPAEVFEWYEQLIQDPIKIKSEIMWEGYEMFKKFVLSKWKERPFCHWEMCKYCFLNQYCNDFIKNQNKLILQKPWNYEIIKGDLSLIHIYEKFWKTTNEFINYIKDRVKKWKILINIPKCILWSWIYQNYWDVQEEKTLEDYTEKYIKNLYRKKSLRCKKCKYYNECEGIHINFIRSYGFSILEPILD